MTLFIMERFIDLSKVTPQTLCQSESRSLVTLGDINSIRPDMAIRKAVSVISPTSPLSLTTAGAIQAPAGLA